MTRSLSRRVAGRLRREWEARPGGRVTHVVTVGAAQDRFLDEAVASVRAQTYRDTDLLVLRWGPGEAVPDLAGARNLALQSAGAPLVRLLEATDTLPPPSTARLVRALRAARRRGTCGAAVGRSELVGGTWRDRAFAPRAGLEPGLGDRLVDVAAWRAAGLRFEEAHGRFGDATVAAADRALRPVVLDEVVHLDHDRAAALPFGHLRAWAREADAWLAAVESCVSGGDAGWAAAVLDRRLPALLGDVESLTDAQWQRVVTVAGRVADLAGEGVRAEHRILGWLAATGKRDQVTRQVVARWRDVDDIPTVVRDGIVLADLGAAAPDQVRRLGPAETPLELVLQSRSRRQAELVAFVRGVETTTAPTVTVRAGGKELPVTTRRTPTASRVAAEAEHCHDHAWLGIELRSASSRVLEVELTSQGVRRTGVLELPRGRVTPTPHTDPRGDDEIGPYAQRRLQRWYAEERPTDPTLAYFQSYTGRFPTDSPRAIHDVLHRTRPEIRTRWLVDSPTARVPEGAEPVLLRSRDWYDTLAGARWVVTNIELERWFRRKPDQAMLQTFHGNPSKVMGVALWRQMGYTPARIEATLAHGPRNWTLLASPSPGMVRHYREQFRYDGPVADRGYPRDDVLVGPDAEQRRTAARVSLGLREGQTAVLYAPTWRDDQATNFRAARLHDGFDPVAAARALGDDHVVLMRGHRFHRDVDVKAPGVLDVSNHPEVNDLLLAADAAVLDYSSLRFDFALTGRPMVFCVPDLDRYVERRGFLFDFPDSAPGPLVRSTQEAVEALRDLPLLMRVYADARQRFHEEFNSYQDGHAAERVVQQFFGEA